MQLPLFGKSEGRVHSKQYRTVEEEIKWHLEMLPSWYHEEWPYSKETHRRIALDCAKRASTFNRKQDEHFIAWR